MGSGTARRNRRVFIFEEALINVILPRFEPGNSQHGDAPMSASLTSGLLRVIMIVRSTAGSHHGR